MKMISDRLENIADSPFKDSTAQIDQDHIRIVESPFILAAATIVNRFKVVCHAKQNVFGFHIGVGALCSVQNLKQV